MTCTHTLGRLVCDRTADHDPAAAGGHTYTASNGSDVPDHHDAAEAAAERTH